MLIYLGAHNKEMHLLLFLSMQPDSNWCASLERPVSAQPTTVRAIFVPGSVPLLIQALCPFLPAGCLHCLERG